MNKQKTLTIRTYEAPDTSTILITQEQCFTASNFHDMGNNPIIDPEDDIDD